jgi:radical S-adenosyl methionine domain-containing protein 2
MDLAPYCGGCSSPPPSRECQDAFLRRGIRRVHWECWSNCSLACEFCFRSISRPLRGELAQRIIRAVATSGAGELVFAGGDPSLHPEIGRLVALAKESGLWVEIQTNGQSLSPRFRDALRQADSVGVSLDSADDAIHDAVRHRRGNYDRVKILLEWLQANHIPTIMRSVAIQQTIGSMIPLGELLKKYPVIQGWSIQELTPVGEAAGAWEELSIEHQQFVDLVGNARSRYGEQVIAVSNEDKSGVYALIRSDGKVYGTGTQKEGAFFPIVGDILSNHLTDIATALYFDPERHSMRYPGGQANFRGEATQATNLPRREDPLIALTNSSTRTANSLKAIEALIPNVTATGPGESPEGSEAVITPAPLHTWPHSGVKAIYFDLDGTLVKDGKVGERTLKLLEDASNSGIVIGVATARRVVAFETLRLGHVFNAPLITSLGAVIKDPTGHGILKTAEISTTDVGTLLGAFEGVQFQSLVWETGILDAGEWTIDSQCSPDLPTAAVTTIEWRGIPESELIDLSPVLENISGIKYVSHVSKIAGCIDVQVVAVEAGKGAALDWVRAREGWPRESVVAVGDSTGDIELFGAAGVSVAMRNAPIEVKGRADFVIDEVTDEGVADLILKILTSMDRNPPQ